MKKLLYIFLSLALITCKHKIPENSAIIEVNKVPEYGLVIDKWHVVGPFPQNNRENFIDIDNLELFSLSEKDFSFKEFIKITKDKIMDTSQIDTSFFSKYYFSGEFPIELDLLFNVDKSEFKGNAYFASNIRCKRDTKTRLHFSSSDGQKIWLNNELICSIDQPKPVLSYEQYIPVKLKKGDNTLLIKVHQIDWMWEMYARLENTSVTGLKRYFSLHNHWILQHSVTFDLDSNFLNTGFPSCTGEMSIYDYRKNILFNDSVYENQKWGVNISSYKNGLYKAKFKTGNIELEHDFYKGDIHDSINKIINILQQTDIPSKNKDEINALIFRYNHLLSNTYNSDKKYVYLFEHLNNAYNYLKQESDPYHHVPGRFIRSYISDIDSSKQYYILHVPLSYKEEIPIPAALIIPAIINKLPYLKSFRVANTKLLEFFQDLSEKYGIIIIEPGSRRYNKPNNNTIEEAELFNILNDIEKDYNLDRNRLYLAGTCSGGNEALKIAVQYPDLFAAIGMVSPEIIYPNKNNQHSYQIDYKPVEFIYNLSNMPIYNTHSLIDRHVAVERSEILDQFIKKAGFKHYKYVRLPNEFPKYYPDDFFDNIFEYCCKYTLNLSPKEINFSTTQMIYNKSFWITINEMDSLGKANIYAKISGNRLKVQKNNIAAYSIDLKTLPYNKNKKLKITDNGKIVYKGMPEDSIIYVGLNPELNKLVKKRKIAGPFSHIFAQKFIVVKGTLGSETENTAINATADTINKYWYDRYYTSCLTKNDFEINNNDIANANLILLGNFTSNAVLSKMEQDIPLKIYSDAIKICNKEFKGNSLGFYMIYPNPLNIKKYVAIIGYNNTNNISLGYERKVFNDVSDYGWFDYKLWEADDPDYTITSGYFNHYWEMVKNE